MQMPGLLHVVIPILWFVSVCVCVLPVVFVCLLVVIKISEWQNEICQNMQTACVGIISLLRYI